MYTLLVDNAVHVASLWVGCLLLLTLLHLQERVTSRHLAHHLGWRGVLLTAWLGVPVHELSHLAAAVFFGHRIVAWRLFDPDPVSGTLGYVRHAYSRRSPWQLVGGFFIAIAPLIGAAVGLAGILWWMAPASAWRSIGRDVALSHPTGLQVLESIRAMGVALWHHRTLLFPVQLYLAICLASHMAPSRADLRGGLWGGMLLALLSLAGAAVAARLGHRLTEGAPALGLLLLLLLVAGLFQGGYAAVVQIWFRVMRRGRPARAACQSQLVDSK